MRNYRSKTWIGTLALAGILGLVVTACGTDDNSASGGKTKIDCATGTVSGAGSTFVQTIVQQWIKNYSAGCPGATVNYQGVGSGAGVQQFTAGTVDFAGSDVPLKDDEKSAAQAKLGDVRQIPWSAGAIAIEYKLSGVSTLRLSGETLAKIFAGQITKWDDVGIKADNPAVALPSMAIQVVHRSDGSGTTAAFTAYLSAAGGGAWTAGSAKDVKWPVGQGAKGSDGVTAAVKVTDGAIGYAETSFAKASGLGMAEIKNAAGKFVAADSPDGVTASLKESEVGPDSVVKVNYTPTGEAAYPISTVTYVMVAQKPADPARARLTRSFIAYALGDGQDAAKGLFYSPLPESLTKPAKVAVESIVVQ